ncbi:hypothetical protein A0U89_04365 [Kozakia baliensis]|uniref:Leucine-binding protein domain-containing protein n=2 Tax=Kozakia baliensis TaxID=153496 RepID=A0A1D8US50_9PROT|nr:hypothetical protein A0U89_04365 [Kozakia baliensis]
MSPLGCKGMVVAFGATLMLSACSNHQTPPPGVGGIPAADQAAEQHGTRIGMLLPLSGRNMRLGQQMANAAHLALPEGHGAELDLRDSDAAEGAAGAARAAIGNGDKIVLGPLTAAQTGEVAPLAQAANIPELAFTSDSTQARPGVWTMGLTPEQQVQRLVEAARGQGKKKFAAFLPDNQFGHVMAQALIKACAASALDSPNVIFHSHDAADIAQSLKTLSDFDARQSQVASATPAEPDAVNPTSDQPAANPPANGDSANAGAQSAANPPQPASAPFPAPPFDALLLADTGLDLANVINGLKANKIDSNQVRILGPALWNAFALKLGALHGAWFAAPDPAARRSYVQHYRARYGSAPSVIADVAYDTAAMAGALSRQENGFASSSLTRADGFAGVDGVFALRPDGNVSRGLAVFEVLPGGGTKIALPAPRRLSQTPS